MSMYCPLLRSVTSMLPSIELNRSLAFTWIALAFGLAKFQRIPSMDGPDMI